MPKREKRNTFDWATLKGFWRFYIVLQENILSKNFTKTMTWKIIPGPVV